MPHNGYHPTLPIPRIDPIACKIRPVIDLILFVFDMSGRTILERSPEYQYRPCRYT